MRARTYAVSAALIACSGSTRDPEPRQTPPPAPQAAQPAQSSLAAPIIPAAAERLGPPRRRAIDGHALADVRSCEPCHQEIVAEWRSSAHAFASFSNPIYRTSVQMLRKSSGFKASEPCAGCHDPALLVDDAMNAEVREADPRAHTGVSCRLCHGIIEATADGNGTYRLADASIYVPKNADDAGDVKRHVASAAPTALHTAALCTSCHRGFLGVAAGNAHHFPGIDEPAAWSRSGYAGSKTARIDRVEQKDCAGCHLPKVEARLPDRAATDGRVASHRFPGAHSWLAAMQKDDLALAEQRVLLEGAATVGVARIRTGDAIALLPEDLAALAASGPLSFDVVVRNARVGHFFPGGSRDIQDTWLEVEVRDARGKLLAEAGAEHDRSGSDPSAHRFGVLIGSEEGEPVLDHETRRFYAPIYDQTLGPRDATVVRYEWSVPSTLPVSPLSISVRLRHRSRSPSMQRATCLESKTASGRAFQLASRTERGASLDACAPQPITEIARATVWIGEGSATRGDAKSRAPRHERLYEHGLGLLREMQEHVADARPSLVVALGELDAMHRTQPSLDRAKVLWALGQVASRQGRAEEALSYFDRAAADAPDHPALARARGEALMRVWRWQEAVAPLRKAAELAPKDDHVLGLLATSTGSAGDPLGAFAAARRALALSPRNEAALRSQAFALRTLSPDDPRSSEALAAYVAHREPDAISEVRFACQQHDPQCALESLPVHTHRLRSAK